MSDATPETCEECGAVAELLACGGPCVLCAVCDACGERGHLDEHCGACDSRYCGAERECPDCAAAVAARDARWDREDADEVARQTESAPEHVAAAERELLGAGATLRYVSRDRSRYYVLGESEIRISDHFVPQTPERDARLGVGRTSGADYEIITTRRDGSPRSSDDVLAEVREAIDEIRS